MPTENRSSNTEMVSVPRETIEQAEKLLQEDNRCTMAREFRTILAKSADQHPGEPVALPTRGKEQQFEKLTRFEREVYAAGRVVGRNDCLDEITKLGPLYTHADPGEVEQLQLEIEKLRLSLTLNDDALIQDGFVRIENRALRSRIDEQNELLREIKNARDWNGSYRALEKRIDATLSASAEPSESEILRRAATSGDKPSISMADMKARYAPAEIDHDALVAAVCVLRSQGLGNLSQAVEVARAALERKP